MCEEKSNNNGTKSQYSHLDSINVTEGQDVEKGTNLGIMDRTGTDISTGIHLDFRIYDANGTPINPLTVLPARPASITIDERYVKENPCTGGLEK